MSTTEHRSYCRFCIAQCGILVTTDGDRVVSVKGDPGDPISGGYTCPKGRALGAFHHDPARLDHPQLRRDGALVRVPWDELLDDLHATVARVVDESGPDAVAIFQATASAYDTNGRRAGDRFLRGLGSRSRYTSATVDAPAKMLVAELVAGHPGLILALDHEEASLVLLVGTNPVVSHGHTNSFPNPSVRLRRLAARGQLWVVDPRRTETAQLANHHLQPRPSTDYALLAFLVRELLRDGADHGYLAEHAEGVERLAAAVERFDLLEAAGITGLEAEQLTGLLEAVRRNGRVAGQTGTGITMSAAANVTEWLLWALHVVTHSFEVPGGMWFQPGLIHRLHERDHTPSDGERAPGPASRPELAMRWGEHPCAALADEIEAGNVRALLVIGGDPATALPDHARLARLLGTLDVLAVADIVESATVAGATHVLAVAGPLEREDTNWYTDWFASAICAQRTGAVLAPAADRRPMHDVFTALGTRLGLVADPALLDRPRTRVPALEHEVAVVAEPPRVRGWVHERVLPGGRWRLAPAPLVAQLAARATPPVAATAPVLVAIPRRAVRRMNSTLHDVERGGEDATIWVHPTSAPGIADGDLVEVRTANGAIRARARVTTAVCEGAASVPHGLPDQNVACLTSTAAEAVDALSGMVTQSGFAVTVSRVAP